MEYFSKDLNSYKLHLIKTDKFKTVTIKILFRSPIVKEEITIRNVLCDILLQSTKNYDSRRKISIKAEDLYSLHINNSVIRNGNYIPILCTSSQRFPFTSLYGKVGSIIYTADIRPARWSAG